MEQGTLLSDLGDSGGSDQDLVQSIMRDINGPSQHNPLSGGGGAPPPPQPGHTPIQRSMNSPNPNSYMQHTMDHQSGQGAHMIGGARPTPADFATLMGQGYMPAMMANGGALPPASAAYGGQQQESGTASKWMNWIFNELRIPLFVAIVFFIFSLPTANVAFAHIFPSMVTATGNMTILGQLTKAGLAGVGFWLLHRVLAPLVG
jgi:hypothetical protein